MASKPQLQQVAMIAEIIGGLAILITLIILVLEMRSNTNSIQAQTYQSLTADLNYLRNIYIESDLAEISLKLFNEDLEALTDSERYKLMFHAEAKWGIYESAYFAEQRGVLGEAEWDRFATAICRNYLGDQLLWDPAAQGKQFLDNGPELALATNVTPRFRSYVETLCHF